MSELQRFIIESPNSNKKELLQTLKDLTVKCQSKEYRDSMDKSLFSDLSSILEMYLSNCDSIGISCDETKILTESFRFIRNSVADSKVNQNEIRDGTGIITWCMKFLEFYITKSTESPELYGTSEIAEDMIVSIRCCIQSIANLMVDNSLSCQKISTEYSDIMCGLITSSKDEKIIQYTAMTFHLALKLYPDWAIIMKPSVLPKLFDNTHFEFVLYVIESLASSESFMNRIFPDVETETRAKFLKVLIAHEEFHAHISQPIIKFLGEQFTSKSDLILNSKLQSDSWLCWEIASLLELLCCITCIDDIVSLFPNSSLLITTVVLLRSVHEAGKIDSTEGNNLAPMHKLDSLSINDETEEMRSQPTYQFKAHLIRLIANLVHRNHHNQELVRELEGLPVILDCSKIDARNPFITQWTVLAIRNLCEGNPTNQEYVHNVQRVDTENALSKLHLVGL